MSLTGDSGQCDHLFPEQTVSRPEIAFFVKLFQDETL